MDTQTKNVAGAAGRARSLPTDLSQCTIRYICAGVRPEWRTLRRFRRNHRDIIRDSLVHVMKQTWAFHFETGEADYVGYEWFESELIHEFAETAVARLDMAALLDRGDTD